jgi:hypothetical protein
MTNPSRTCFVVGPIGKRRSKERIHADALFNKIIKPALVSIKKSFHVVRADHISTPGMIDSQIITHLIEARLVIADLTTRNPNAFYELGVRHMVQKPVIHIYKRGERIPADVSLFRAVEISYSSAVAIGKSRADLAKAIKATFLPGFAVETPVTQSKGFQRLLRPSTPREERPKPTPPPPPSPTLKYLGPWPPRIEGAVNLLWKLRRGDLWEARWQAPSNIIDRGFTVRSVKLWSGPEGSMDPETSEFIRDTTLQLEDEITRWLNQQSS